MKCFLSSCLVGGMLSIAAVEGVAEPAQPLLADMTSLEATGSRSFLEWDKLTGDWGGLRTTLSDNGIDVEAQYYVEGWGNTTGGLETGTVYTGLGQISLGLDFEKLVGWEGASFYTRWLWLSGRDASEDLVGNFFTISNIAGFNTFRNIELWFQQNLWDDKISLRIGQLAADSEFVISEYGSLFINGTFGWPAFIYTSIPNGGPGYPMGAPGIRLSLTPIEPVTLMAAVFQGDVFPQDVNRQGFRWRLNSEQGFLWLAESQFRLNQGKDDTGLPGTYKAGAWFQSGTYADISENGDEYWGNLGFYFIVDQMLYREPSAVESAPASKDGKTVTGKNKIVVPSVDAESSNQGLGTFARFAFEPQDRNFLGFYFDTGLSYTGLIPGRDEDVIGIALGYGQLTNGAKDVLASSGETHPDYEIVLEFTYQANLTPWLSVQPDLQYIAHPGGTRTLGDAWVLGIRTVVTF